MSIELEESELRLQLVLMELAKCNFIQAHELVEGTAVEGLATEIIEVMVNLINESSRMSEKLEEFDVFAEDL